MRKRKQPCRHYRRIKFAQLSLAHCLNAYVKRRNCPNCVHWEWQTYPCKEDLCARNNCTCPERYTCRRFHGIWKSK